MKTARTLIKTSIEEGSKLYQAKNFTDALDVFKQARGNARQHISKIEYRHHYIEASIHILNCYVKMTSLDDQYSNIAQTEYTELLSEISTISPLPETLSTLFNRANKNAAQILYPILWNQALEIIVKIEPEAQLAYKSALYDTAINKFDICRQFEILLNNQEDADKTAQRLQILLEEKGDLFADEAEKEPNQNLKLQYLNDSQTSYQKALSWAQQYPNPSQEEIVPIYVSALKMLNSMIEQAKSNNDQSKITNYTNILINAENQYADTLVDFNAMSIEYRLEALYYHFNAYASRSAITIAPSFTNEARNIGNRFLSLWNSAEISTDLALNASMNEITQFMAINQPTAVTTKVSPDKNPKLSKTQTLEYRLNMEWNKTLKIIAKIEPAIANNLDVRIQFSEAIRGFSNVMSMEIALGRIEDADMTLQRIVNLYEQMGDHYFDHADRAADFSLKLSYLNHSKIGYASALEKLGCFKRYIPKQNDITPIFLSTLQTLDSIVTLAKESPCREQALQACKEIIEITHDNKVNCILHLGSGDGLTGLDEIEKLAYLFNAHYTLDRGSVETFETARVILSLWNSTEVPVDSALNQTYQSVLQFIEDENIPPLATLDQFSSTLLLNIMNSHLAPEPECAGLDEDPLFLPETPTISTSSLRDLSVSPSKSCHPRTALNSLSVDSDPEENTLKTYFVRMD